MDAGDVYGRLTVIKAIDKTWVVCRCACGTVKTVRASNLKHGHTSSCGCYRKELQREVGRRTGGQLRTHNLRKDAVYKTWSAMRWRVTSSRQASYADCTACQYLLSDPRHLVAIIGPRNDTAMTLDRFPVPNGNYTCGQCQECTDNGWAKNIRWATKSEQSENRTCVIRYDAFGKSMSITAWEHESGIDKCTLEYRIRVKGMSMEQALSTPNRSGRAYNPTEVEHPVH